MLPIFNRPLDELSAKDVTELVTQSWPEGTTIEFKKTLRGKKGGDDPWHRGGNMLDRSRDEILSELVAFANSHGGTLVLGIEETVDKPPRAAASHLIGRCAELADRLTEQARQCVEPRLPTFGIMPIPMERSGAGVVVMRVPQSRLRPHRLTTTLEAYHRKADRCERMTMREIQDLTLHAARSQAVIEQTFETRSQQFRQWYRDGPPAQVDQPRVAVRVTAIPVAADIYVERIYGRPEFMPNARRYVAQIAGEDVEIALLRNPDEERPILRGSRRFRDNVLSNASFSVYQEGHCEGILEIGERLVFPANEDRPGLPCSRILGAVANMLTWIDAFRTAAGAPDAEFGMDVEVAAEHVPLWLLNLAHELTRSWLGIVEPNPIVLPRLSIGQSDEFNRILNIVLTDVTDATGTPHTDEDQLVHVDFSESEAG